jgi:alkylation response protein AidB-like acyl-CoA dehydrogenase
MNFNFTDEQNKFRQEVRHFLNRELPADYIEYIGTTIDDSVVHVGDGFGIFKKMARKYGEKGWLSMSWPKEYGGSSGTNIDNLIFFEEIARRGSPGFNAVGTKMLAPTLIIFGNQEQKGKYLEPIARGEQFWCEGFSEPEAGSDLAALQTKAIRSGDYYIVNGQKTWSTLVTYCDHCCLLARTDPDSKRHRGLSFLLVDLNTPGITVKPIENLLGEPHFGEIFFEDAKVPVTNLVGAENDGWKVAQTFLGYERVYIAPFAVVNTMIDKLAEYFSAHPADDMKTVQDALAEFTVEAEVGRMICYQVAWLQDHDRATEWHAAITRLFGTRLLKRAASSALQLLGLYGQLNLHDDRAPLKGWIEHLYYSAIGSTIAAGTTEIQKTVIAVRGLGMTSN